MLWFLYINPFSDLESNILYKLVKIQQKDKFKPLAKKENPFISRVSFYLFIFGTKKA